MNRKRLFTVFSLVLLSSFALPAESYDLTTDSTEDTSQIIDRYLQATQVDSLNLGTVQQIDIDASVPSLKQHGKLRALRKISAVGKITYRVLGFQGDSTVKNQVIARYLQAEQQSQGDNKLTVSPANYKFHFKGRTSSEGHQLYVFQLTPRAKRVGLFKGEIWLDANTYLPVLEKGRLVKNPSIFFRKVDFERDFAIENGSAIPAHMSSTISTRIIGKVNLDIAYSNPTTTESDTVDAEGSESPTSF